MRRQRRQLSVQFKLETVLEGLRGEKREPPGRAQMRRERNITDSLYYKWRGQFTQQAVAILGEAGPARSSWNRKPALRNWSVWLGGWRWRTRR